MKVNPDELHYWLEEARAIAEVTTPTALDSQAPQHQAPQQPQSHCEAHEDGSSNTD